MKNKDIEFNEEHLLRGMEQALAHAKGKLTCRTTVLPAPVQKIEAKDIKAIRSKLHVSQRVFAAILNVPPVTAVSWETGQRHPSGAALRLLDIARKNPQTLLSVI